MPIERPQEYMNAQLGLGKIAGYQQTLEDTVTAGAVINFGQAVAIKNGAGVPATDKDQIYGIAVAKRYLPDFTDDSHANGGTYAVGELVPVLRKGVVSVQVSAYVTRFENAAVDANGDFTLAKDAGIGVFQNDATSGNNANVEIDLPYGVQPAATTTTDNGGQTK